MKSLNGANGCSSYTIGKLFAEFRYQHFVSTTVLYYNLQLPNTMQIWSLTITLLSATVRLIDKGKCDETVTVLTNQTDVDQTYSPIALTWPRSVRGSKFNVALKARKIVKRQVSEQNDTSDSPAATTADQHRHHPSGDALRAARDDRHQKSDTGAADTNQTQENGNQLQTLTAISRSVLYAFVLYKAISLHTCMLSWQ